jgi:hypothetical protein
VLMSGFFTEHEAKDAIQNPEHLLSIVIDDDGLCLMDNPTHVTSHLSHHYFSSLLLSLSLLLLVPLCKFSSNIYKGQSTTMNLRITHGHYIFLLVVITVVVVGLSNTPAVDAWSPLHKSSTYRKISSLSSTTALQVGVAWNFNHEEQEEEHDYNNIVSSGFMMHRAQVCADSDSCSLEDAQTCLKELLHVQMQCIGSGVLSPSAVCDVGNVDVVADIVDKLRNKIQEESQRLVWVKSGMNIINIVLGVTIVSMILHGLVADPNVPVDSMTLTMIDNDPTRAVVPFLPIEWIWAVRDGYVPTLVSQWFQHGGLVVDSSSYDIKAAPLTPQEWIWTVQNGSFGHLLKENMKYGGLLVDMSYQSETIPLEAKELWWALNGGYLEDVFRHFFRNGGL